MFWKKEKKNKTKRMWPNDKSNNRRHHEFQRLYRYNEIVLIDETNWKTDLSLQISRFLYHPFLSSSMIHVGMPFEHCNADHHSLCKLSSKQTSVDWDTRRLLVFFAYMLMCLKVKNWKETWKWKKQKKMHTIACKRVIWFQYLLHRP